MSPCLRACWGAQAIRATPTPSQIECLPGPPDPVQRTATMQSLLSSLSQRVASYAKGAEENAISSVGEGPTKVSRDARLPLSPLANDNAKANSPSGIAAVISPFTNVLLKKPAGHKNRRQRNRAPAVAGAAQVPDTSTSAADAGVDAAAVEVQVDNMAGPSNEEEEQAECAYAPSPVGDALLARKARAHAERGFEKDSTSPIGAALLARKLRAQVARTLQQESASPVGAALLAKKMRAQARRDAAQMCDDNESELDIIRTMSLEEDEMEAEMIEEFGEEAELARWSFSPVQDAPHTTQEAELDAMLVLRSNSLRSCDPKEMNNDDMHEDEVAEEEQQEQERAAGQQLLQPPEHDVEAATPARAASLLQLAACGKDAVSVKLNITAATIATLHANTVQQLEGAAVVDADEEEVDEEDEEDDDEPVFLALARPLVRTVVGAELGGVTYKMVELKQQATPEGVVVLKGSVADEEETARADLRNVTAALISVDATEAAADAALDEAEDLLAEIEADAMAEEALAQEMEAELEAEAVAEEVATAAVESAMASVAADRAAAASATVSAEETRPLDTTFDDTAQVAPTAQAPAAASVAGMVRGARRSSDVSWLEGRRSSDVSWLEGRRSSDVSWLAEMGASSTAAPPGAASGTQPLFSLSEGVNEVSNDADDDDDDQWLIKPTQLVELDPPKGGDGSEDTMSWLRRITMAAGRRQSQAPLKREGGKAADGKPKTVTFEQPAVQPNFLNSPPANGTPGGGGRMRLSFFLRTPPSAGGAANVDKPRRISHFFRAPKVEAEVEAWLKSTTPNKRRTTGGPSAALGAISEGTAEPEATTEAASEAAVPEATKDVREVAVKPAPAAQAPKRGVGVTRPAFRGARAPAPPATKSAPAGSTSRSAGAQRAPATSARAPTAAAAPAATAPPKPRSKIGVAAPSFRPKPKQTVVEVRPSVPATGGGAASRAPPTGGAPGYKAPVRSMESIRASLKRPGAAPSAGGAAGKASTSGAAPAGIPRVAGLAKPPPAASGAASRSTGANPAAAGKRRFGFGSTSS